MESSLRSLSFHFLTMTFSKTPVLEPQFFYWMAINITSKSSFSFSKGLPSESLRSVISGDDDDDGGKNSSSSHYVSLLDITSSVLTVLHILIHLVSPPCEAGTIFASQMVRFWHTEKLSNCPWVYGRKEYLFQRYESSKIRICVKALCQCKALYKWQQSEEPTTDELNLLSLFKILIHDIFKVN